MNEWHRILNKVLTTGYMRPDRTGVGTLALFGEQLCFDNRLSWDANNNILVDHFPAVTTKRLAYGQVAAELRCFLKGLHSLEQFHAEGCRIWDDNGGATYWKDRARFDGDLGRIYGVQWRDWLSAPRAGGQPPKSTDQLIALIDGLFRDPYGRRHVVTAWNPGELDQMCLPPCHVLWQCFVRPGEGANKVLDLRVDMRSVDLFLGLPFDIASYATIQRLLAQQLGMESGWLTFQLGDAHIYLNHQDAVRTVLTRVPYEPPGLWLHVDATLLNFNAGDADLLHYTCHPAVPAPLNV